MNSVTTSPSSPSRRLRLGLFGVVTLVIGIDQLSKAWAESRLGDGDVIPLIDDFLQFRLIYNPGAALSIANGQTWLITLVVVAVTIGIIRLSGRLRSVPWVLALSLVLGGGIGNLIDRLFRDPGFAQGHVVDFIDYNGWFVGNVADIAIVVGAAIAIILVMRGVDFDGTVLADADADADRRPEDLEARTTSGDTSASEPRAVPTEEPGITTNE